MSDHDIEPLDMELRRLVAYELIDRLREEVSQLHRRAARETDPDLARRLRQEAHWRDFWKEVIRSRFHSRYD